MSDIGETSVDSSIAWEAFHTGRGDWSAWVEARVLEERRFVLDVVGEVVGGMTNDLNQRIEKGIIELRLAAKVQDGADGRSFNVRGTFSPGARYRTLDVVALNGASFVAKCDDPGPIPGDNWQLLAVQGKKGQPGRDGTDGKAGKDAPRITDWAVNRENYTATPIMSDGSRGAVLDLRLLFERYHAETE
jgi:hypothetical protein